MKCLKGKTTLALALLAMSTTTGCVGDAPEDSGANNPISDAGNDAETTGDVGPTEDAADSGVTPDPLTLTFSSVQSGEVLYRWAPLTPAVSDESGDQVACDDLQFRTVSGEIEADPGPGFEVRVLTESATIGGTCTRAGESRELAAATVDTVPLPTVLPDAWLMAHYGYENDVWTSGIGGAQWSGSQEDGENAPVVVRPSTSGFPTLSFAGDAALFLDNAYDFDSNDLTITWVGSYDPTRSKSTWFASCFQVNQQVFNLDDKLTFENGDAAESVEVAQAGITESSPRTIRFAADGEESIEISGWVDGTFRRSDSIPNFEVRLRDIGGRCTSPTGDWLIGTMSEVLIHESALPQSEIEWLHAYLKEKYQ